MMKYNNNNNSNEKEYNKKKEEGCPGFGWDRVNFLPSSWYSAVFWI